MSLKILGGTLKGMDIKSVSFSHKNSKATRPTSVLLRRKFFDANQDLSNYTFIDLCAGTGSMAFEALSRGSSLIVCNDLSKINLKLLKENIKTIKSRMPDAQIELSNQSFEKFKLTSNYKDGIIFFDPPYEKIDLYKEFKMWMDNSDLSGMQVVIEYCRQKTCSTDEFNKIFGVPDKNYQQGTSFLSVYRF